MPLPKSAKRVFKGTLFDVYQWRQKMFDGSYKIFESIKRQDAVVVLATVKNKIVVLKQKQPNTGWYLSEPGGRMDKAGESPKNAALRELLEETGLKPKKLILWKKSNPGHKVMFTLYIFIARDCKQAAKASPDNGEIIQTKLVSFEDFLKLSDNPNYVYGDLLPHMLRARISKSAKSKFKKLIFG